MSQPDPKTRTPRTSVMLSAHVFAIDGTGGSQHRVVNLSATGVCIVGPDDLDPGSTVCVSVGQADHAAAEVVWVRGGLAGLRFRDPIDLAKARARRADGSAPPPPSAGWLGELADAYRS